MTFDRVAVCEKGSIIEFDKPEVLLKDSESVFYSIAESYSSESVI